jgi:hypothetical protein
MSDTGKVNFYLYKNTAKTSGVQYLGASLQKMKQEDKDALCRIIQAGGRVNIYKNEKKSEDWQADYTATAYAPDEQRQPQQQQAQRPAPQYVQGQAPLPGENW